MSESAGQRNFTIDNALDELSARLTELNPKSSRRQEQAEAHMPGGNTRTLLYYPPFPIAFARGEGCRLWDVDGHEYLDLVGEQSAGIYGHSDPRILDLLQKIGREGLNLGGPNKYEAKLAEAVCDRFPFIEQVRFCNSGTEANMFALSTACAFTGRSKIMAFSGGYHGGLLTFPNGPGPLNSPIPTVVASFNDVNQTHDLLERNADDLAAVIIEPMMGAAGCLPPSAEFLRMLRDSCDREGIVLIFDEVMTSRLGPSGMQGRLGIRPDLTTLGKYIGGGMSFGAFGGRRELMERFDPRRPDHWIHAGTFNNNVLTMAAGTLGLTEIYTPEAAVTLNESGDRLRGMMNDAASKRNLPVTVTGIGSLMNIHFARHPITTPADVAKTSSALKSLLHLDFLLNGIYIARRGYIALSLPVGTNELAYAVSTFEAFLDRWIELISDDAR
ncbi:aspartate aminotransferase family protein (plasmid) [Rhizobium sp. CB3060]|uniref:aspartate aminotransferase family protein n=1 Tax=Rhizobium sp. CB3060 TaxID=3138255 RepID=UPI0021A6E7EC|nr:aspartate aminotransferase family protein [Rhizobium tropici]UWU25421.1 aspartate aminotransferase family protein [Rhizobium tropici]